MGNNVGQSAAIMAAVDAVEWRTYAQILESVEPRFHKQCGAILSQKVAAGRVVRRGAYRAFEYRRAPDQVAWPTNIAAMRNPVFAASLGLVCGQQELVQ